MLNEVAAGPVQVIVNPSSSARWAVWITKGSLAILDQGLIAGSNFFIGILLARWLAPQQYGSYALAFAVFLLLSALHQSILLEPQRIFGPSEYRNCLREYLGMLLGIGAGLTLAITVALFAFAGAIHLWAPSNGLPGALFGIGVAAPCVLLMWLARGAFYVKLSPQNAVTGGLIYCVLVLAGMFLIHRLHIASPFSAFVVMAAGALVSSLVLLYRLKPVFNVGLAFREGKAVFHRHWQYGRWVLASLALNAVAGDIYYPLVSSFSGLAAAGQLKALMNFYMLVAQTFSALSIFLLPYACRILAEKGLPALKTLTWKLGCLFAALAAAYWVALVTLSVPLLHFVYGDRYVGLSPLVIWVAAAALPWNLSIVPAIALRAVQSSSSIFVMYFASSAVAVVVGIAATWIAGLHGALVGMSLSNLAALIVALVLLGKKLRTPAVAGA